MSGALGGEGESQKEFAMPDGRNAPFEKELCSALHWALRCTDLHISLNQASREVAVATVEKPSRDVIFPGQNLAKKRQNVSHHVASLSL